MLAVAYLGWHGSIGTISVGLRSVVNAVKKTFVRSISTGRQSIVPFPYYTTTGKLVANIKYGHLAMQNEQKNALERKQIPRARKKIGMTQCTKDTILYSPA